MPKNNVIALIGMSNIGKSHWAKRLADAGYLNFSIDDIIAAKFANQSIHDVSDLAKWLGQPWERNYADREKIYLDLENEAVLEVLEQVSMLSPNTKVVIDTTGSMFYAPQSTIDRLVNTALMAYLVAPDHVKQRLLQKYIDNPKPVVWGGMYRQNGSETKGQALARSYQELLEFRTQKYAQYSEVLIDYDARFKPDFKTEDFLAQIQ